MQQNASTTVILSTAYSATAASEVNREAKNSLSDANRSPRSPEHRNAEIMLSLNICLPAVIPPGAEILAGKCDRGLVKSRDHEICKIFIV